MTLSGSSQLQIGLYGAGPHSRSVLLPALTSLEYPLEAICDPRPDLADNLAERFAFRSTFTDLPSMLRDSSVQALLISRDAPNLPDIVDTLLKSRLPFWLDAAADGLDPLVVRLKRRAANNSPAHMICHPHRFAPALLRASELIRAGRLGELNLGSLHISSPKAPPGQKELPLTHLAEAALDLLVSLLGQPDRVYSSWDGLSFLTAVLHFDNKPLSLQLRHGVSPACRTHCLRLYGHQDQQLVVQDLIDLSATEAEAVLARFVPPMASSTDICVQHGWTGALAAFFAAAALRTPDPGDLTDYLSTRKLTETLIRSAESAREVKFRL